MRFVVSMRARLSNLDVLESESMYIMREAVATSERPVMFYSVGKDSSVLLHLARKAFYPSRPPFPLLHVDTTWEFSEMYSFRDQTARSFGLDIIVHQNPYCLENGINPFDHGSAVHTDLWKTEGLLQALANGKFDVAFAGARRDEERARAKERVFSVRSASQRWDPKAQRPEIWNLYNTSLASGQTLRVFPLSNWTEMDIWSYIRRESVPIVSLYFAKERPCVVRDDGLIVVDDDRFRFQSNESAQMRKVRFRTLGCYPLTGAIESNASSIDEIVEELTRASTSERYGRVIDHDVPGSMEIKRRNGYF